MEGGRQVSSAPHHIRIDARGQARRAQFEGRGSTKTQSPAGQQWARGLLRVSPPALRRCLAWLAFCVAAKGGEEFEPTRRRRADCSGRDPGDRCPGVDPGQPAGRDGSRCGSTRPNAGSSWSCLPACRSSPVSVSGRASGDGSPHASKPCRNRCRSPKGSIVPVLGIPHRIRREDRPRGAAGKIRRRRNPGARRSHASGAPGP